MFSQKPFKLLILFCFLFFLGIVLSFGLQPEYRQKVLSVFQPRSSPEPVQESGRKIFFPIQEKVKPEPTETKREPRQPEVLFTGNNTTLAEQKPHGPTQSASRGTPEEPGGLPPQAGEPVPDTTPDEQGQGEKPKPEEARFAIQAGACRKRINAEYLAEELERKGYKPTIYTDQHNDGSHWYKVRVGAYKTQNEAEKALADYQNEINANAFIIRLDRAG